MNNEVIRTPYGDFAFHGKVGHVVVTFTEVDPEYEPEPETDSGEVTREELEYALSIISKWNAPRKAPQGQPTV